MAFEFPLERETAQPMADSLRKLSQPSLRATCRKTERGILKGKQVGYKMPKIKALFRMMALSAVAVSYLAPRYSPTILGFATMSASPSKQGAMLAVSYEVHGDASVLSPGRYPHPVPVKDRQVSHARAIWAYFAICVQYTIVWQVLVRVAAASINPCDFKFRRTGEPCVGHA